MLNLDKILEIKMNEEDSDEECEIIGLFVLYLRPSMLDTPSDRSSSTEAH
jgi:hypothetical protein